MKTIVVSAINFRDGGPLSILKDCLKFLSANLGKEYRIVALVHKKEVIEKYENVEILEFPLSVKSYIFRLYYEYFHFKQLSLMLKPALWLSLHDVTPNVMAQVRAVYCHNPAPFYKLSLKEALLEPKFALFNWFYQYLYKINIHKNDYVIVQQNWLRKRFADLFRAKRIVVSYPESAAKTLNPEKPCRSGPRQKFQFFFPSFPRIFKNFEVICEAVKLIRPDFRDKFEVILTIDGSETRYSASVYQKFKDVKELKFIGLVSREKVYEYYNSVDCLVFPSKLETWGLPISEFKQFLKPVLLSRLDFARETVGNYPFKKFFDPDSPAELAEMMMDMMQGTLSFDESEMVEPEMPFGTGWGKLFEILLNHNNMAEKPVGQE